MAVSGRIRVGVGGWDYEPWRQTYYPEDLPKKKQLEYSSRQLTAIEINGTFYRLQKPEVFAKWRDDTPDDFVFTLKAPRYIVQRKVLAEAGEAIERFIASGVGELKHKLGPILWQLAPTKRFDAEDLEQFLKHLPREIGHAPARHALEVRHESFMTAQFIDLARRYGVTTVFVDSEEHPRFADLTSNFVYARLRRSAAEVVTGYSTEALATWTQRAQQWSRGESPNDLPRIEQAPAKAEARDVFLFFISGAKERAPAAAKQVIANLREASTTKNTQDT
jgi:uncharacterized protein YecE (DUF72 family)